MSDKDRKEWELTDGEYEDIWNRLPAGHSYTKAVATAAARKAMEWAARKCAPVEAQVARHPVEWGRGYLAAALDKEAMLRKELSDG